MPLVRVCGVSLDAARHADSNLRMWIRGASWGSAARGGLCKRNGARTIVGLQTVYRDELLLLAHLDGEGLGSSGLHHIWAGGWGC